jgi:hypothetical protein
MLPLIILLNKRYGNLNLEIGAIWTWLICETNSWKCLKVNLDSEFL